MTDCLIPITEFLAWMKKIDKDQVLANCDTGYRDGYCIQNYTSASCRNCCRERRFMEEVKE